MFGRVISKIEELETRRMKMHSIGFGLLAVVSFVAVIPVISSLFEEFAIEWILALLVIAFIFIFSVRGCLRYRNWQIHIKDH